MARNEYDEEPVYYCKRCLSLNIRQMPILNHQDYCGECGSAEVGCVDIEEWNQLYEKKYGHPYIDRTKPKWPYWC
jgi:hypothetical protein